MRKSLIEKAIRKIQGSSKVDSRGGACNFYSVTEKIGIKCYRHASTRDETYTCQKNAARLGLAPRTYGVCDLLGYHCYFTQVVKTAETWESQMRTMDDWRNEGEYIKNIDDIKSEIREWENEFEEKTGCYYCDAHFGNFGYLPNGKLVCIDWDLTESFYHKISKKSKIPQLV